jgi:transcriptional regulator with PAS, ATPase and Fis domain
MAQAGEFREDLYYRLNVFPIYVPPLRERKDDIPDLVDYFIRRFAAEEGKKVSGIEPTSLSVICDYVWPGNVRQLENAVFRAKLRRRWRQISRSISSSHGRLTRRLRPRRLCRPVAGFKLPIRLAIFGRSRRSKAR